MADINPQVFELLHETLKTLKEGQERIEDKVDAGFDKMNGRVRKLENWWWYVMGIFGAVIILLQVIRK